MRKMWMIRAGKNSCFIDTFKNMNIIGIEGDVGSLENEPEEEIDEIFNKRYHPLVECTSHYYFTI